MLLVAACTPWPVGAQPAPQVSFRLADRDPSSRTTLASGQPLYLRIAYESNVPVRFRAEAYSGGELVERGAAYNPAPPYPAGDGEGLAWISFREATTIDEIRLTAHDDRWKEIATASYSIDVSWSGARARPREPVSWARRLSDEQQQVMSTAATNASEEDDVLGGVVIAAMGLSIPAYLLLQAFMLLRFRHGWRMAAMVPLVGMIPLALYTLFGLLAGSNLWPLGLLFLTPLALGYLILLSVARFVIPHAARSSG